MLHHLHLLNKERIVELLKNICMYLFGCTGLSCGMWDLVP